MIKLIKSFFAWIKRLFSKKKHIHQNNCEEIIVIPKELKKLNPFTFFDALKNGENFFSDKENLCVKVSKNAYVEFVRKMKQPVVVCYRKISDFFVR